MRCTSPTVPAELGPDYAAACAVFGLDPDPGGYALYLADTMAGRRTLISHDLPRLRAALDAACGGHRQFLPLVEVLLAGLPKGRFLW